MVLQRLLLARIRPAERLLDLEHRRRLHDLFNSRRIVDAWKLNKYLVIAEAMLLNDGLAHAELVNAITDGFDGLPDGAGFQIGEALRLHRDGPGVFRP